ncbi:MAG: hypothetical protein LBD59_05040, partial [Prevotellaceae bacterium]|nr:hypothetical protein [Prevotellaceae bacterium]
MKSTIKILLFCILPLACTQTGDKWQKVRYEKSTTEKYSVTNCNKNGQMIEKAYVYFDSDTLYIDFPPQLPAYWDAVKIKIHNEKFCSEACGIPFAPIKIAFTPVEQRLQLNSRDIAPGDTLCGNFTLVFQYTATPEMDNDYDKPEQGAYTLQGSICEVVRDKNYDPFANSNFMDFDLPAALRELGEPLLREQFDLSAP